jgi:A/G-specific adenine glycosylase
MPKKPTFFSKKLIIWYLQNKRDLPWRGKKDPYCIWLSEIMLQQTRVAQGLPYYLKFIKAFPTVKELALASEDRVLKLWQGLGYYSRARNLHMTAKYIYHDCNGKFPSDYSGLLQLKGVGDYTASAIASICYNKPTAVVDGNVYRVLSRVFGVNIPVNSSFGTKEFKKLAQLHLDETQPGTHNQAIMEFGARFCVPQNPDCLNCIFNENCVAFNTNAVSILPVKLKKTPVKKRYFNYLVIHSEDNKTILQKRTDKGIWQQLYEFPLIETPKEITIDELRAHRGFQALSDKYRIESVQLHNKHSLVHKLSHQHLYTRFWIVETRKLREKGTSFSTVKDYAVPVLIENFISDFRTI